MKHFYQFILKASVNSISPQIFNRSIQKSLNNKYISYDHIKYFPNTFIAMTRALLSQIMQDFLLFYFLHSF